MALVVIMAGIFFKLVLAVLAILFYLLGYTDHRNISALVQEIRDIMRDPV